MDYGETLSPPVIGPSPLALELFTATVDSVVHHNTQAPGGEETQELLSSVSTYIVSKQPNNLDNRPTRVEKRFEFPATLMLRF